MNGKGVIMRNHGDITSRLTGRFPRVVPASSTDNGKTKAICFCIIGFVLAGMLLVGLFSGEKKTGRKRGAGAAQYEKTLAWYNHQLEYYDMLEISVHDDYMMLFDKNRNSFSIQLAGDLLTYPKSMPRGYAKKLLSARMRIMKYERAHGYQWTGVKRIIPGHPSHQGL